MKKHISIGTILLIILAIIATCVIIVVVKEDPEILNVFKTIIMINKGE